MNAGFRKVDNARIERAERFRRRGRCFLTIGAFTGEPYCGTHGRMAGWPCSVGHRSSLTAWPGLTAERLLARLS